MVFGVASSSYLEVTRNPKIGWVIAAVGFTGKVRGPIRMANLSLRGDWLVLTVVLCLTSEPRLVGSVRALPVRSLPQWRQATGREDDGTTT